MLIYIYHLSGLSNRDQDCQRIKYRKPRIAITKTTHPMKIFSKPTKLNYTKHIKNKICTKLTNTPRLKSTLNDKTLLDFLNFCSPFVLKVEDIYLVLSVRQSFCLCVTQSFPDNFSNVFIFLQLPFMSEYQIASSRPLSILRSRS